MYYTTNFRKGLKIELEGKPFIIVDFLHVKPGKGGAFVRTRLKNMETGQVLEKTFRSGDKVDRPDLVEREMQYLYQDAEGYCFMDNNNYEQIFIDDEHLGESKDFLTENVDVKVLFFTTSLSVLIYPFSWNYPSPRPTRVCGGTQPRVPPSQRLLKPGMLSRFLFSLMKVTG